MLITDRTLDVFGAIATYLSKLGVLLVYTPRNWLETSNHFCKTINSSSKSSRSMLVCGLDTTEDSIAATAWWQRFSVQLSNATTAPWFCCDSQGSLNQRTPKLVLVQPLQGVRVWDGLHFLLKVKVMNWSYHRCFNMFHVQNDVFFSGHFLGSIRFHRTTSLRSPSRHWHVPLRASEESNISMPDFLKADHWEVIDSYSPAFSFVTLQGGFGGPWPNTVCCVHNMRQKNT